MNNIRTTIITCFFIGYVMFSWSQASTDNSALELATLLHKNKIERNALTNSEAKLNSTTLNLNNKEYTELYKSISQKHAQRFKPTELKELINFYTSPLGKKLLHAYPLMMADANTLISKLQMKQLGMEEPNITEDPILLHEEKLVLEAANNNDFTSKSKKVQPKKAVVKVEALEQLQAILKNNPNLIYEPIELSQLLDISVVPNILNELEISIIRETEGDNPVKN